MDLLVLLQFLLYSFFAVAKPLPDDTILVSPTGSSTKHDPLDQKPAHERRGIAYNDVALAKYFETDGSHVTWRYNWDSSSPPSNAWFRFVPMLHSLRDDHTGQWKENAEAVAKENWKQRETATWLLGFNEPDNCISDAGGSCIDVPTAVAGWKKHMQPLSTFNSKMYLGSPAVANASPSDTRGLRWLAKFMESCDGCTVDFINLHWYGSAHDIQNFKGHINDARKIAKGLPIWITEFHASGTDEEVRDFLNEVMPWMDNSQDIHRYAYFMARPGKGLLVNEAGDGLSEIGKEFNLYHKHLFNGTEIKGANGERWWEEIQQS